MNALSNLGLDTSGWLMGVDKLVRQEQQESLKSDKREGDEYQLWEARGQWGETSWGDSRNPRARSRSPSHRCASMMPTYRKQFRMRSPPRRVEDPDSEIEEGQEFEDDDEDDNSSPGPTIHVIDVQDLFVALSLDSSYRKKPLHNIAHRLGIPVVLSAMCAGNDCQCVFSFAELSYLIISYQHSLLIRTWMAMASGSPIDEQRVERWSCPPDECLPIERPGGVEVPEEVDINDIDPSTIQSSARVFREPGCNNLEADDSEDEDW